MRPPLHSLFLWIPLVAACAQGGKGRAPGGGGAPPPASIVAVLPGLSSAAAGPGAIQVAWHPAGAGEETALFVSTSRADLYDGLPTAMRPGESTFALTGLTNGVVHFLGLGLRAIGDTNYAPAGIVFSCRPGDPIYVDASADPSVADGLTPETAFADLTRALLSALLSGGANVWVRSGDYEAANLPLFAGVHVYGGFDGTFALDRRDTSDRGTRWNSFADAITVGIQGGEPAVVMDGIHLNGRGIGSIGIDLVDAAVELRNVTIRNFVDRGIRARNGTDTDYDLIVASGAVSGNGADGVSVAGAFDLVLDASSFDGNGQEGVELDALVALAGDSAHLVVRGCGFAGNASEGLDADLEAPLVPGVGGARFDVSIEGSSFEENGLDGLLIDLDFEGVPGWRAEITVRGCRSRANGASGFHVDADAESEVFFHRVSSTANVGDGLLVSSESKPGLAFVTSSVFAANLGAGVRATFGNRTLVATHCVLGGNGAGGIVSDTVEASVSSSVFWLQPNAAVGTRLVSSPAVDDAATRVFINAPESYLRVASLVGDTLTVSPSTESVPLSGMLELADDGAPHPFSVLSTVALAIDGAPSGFLVPGSVVAFKPGAGVAEDYRLASGSPAEAAGLVSPGAAARDAGLFGAPSGGAPGVADSITAELFRPVATNPPLAVGLAEDESLELVFSADVDPASFVLDEVRAVRPDGSEIGITMQTSGRRVLITPSSGWGREPFVVELHTGLRAKSGEGLAASAVLPIGIR